MIEKTVCAAMQLKSEADLLVSGFEGKVKVGGELRCFALPRGLFVLVACDWWESLLLRELTSFRTANIS